MSQHEILTYIEKHPNTWFTAKDLQKKFSLNLGTLQENMKKIARYNFAQYKKEQDKGSRKKLYIKHNQNI